MGSLTPNWSLYKPDTSETGWGDSVSGNFDTIDAQLGEAVNVSSLSGGFASAIAGAGTTPTTIIIEGQFRVTADLTVPGTIQLLFRAGGRLTTDPGVTLTLDSPSIIICPKYQWCIDCTTGSLVFTRSGWVHPGWLGAIPGASIAQNTTALQKLAAALGNNGGGVWFPPFIIQVNNTITWTGPVCLVGISPYISIVELTTAATLVHGFVFTTEHEVVNLQIRTQFSMVSDFQNYGIRFDLDSQTLPTKVRIVYSNLVIRGFNNGLYGDGGQSYNVSQSMLQNIDIQVSGPASTYIGSCVYQHRMTKIIGDNLLLDQNNTGNHGGYLLGNKNVYLRATKVINASRPTSQSLKIVGNGAVGQGDQQYAFWNVDTLDMTNCANGLLFTTFGTETLGIASARNVYCRDVTGEAATPGNIQFVATDSSSIKQCIVDGYDLENAGYTGIHFSIGASASILRMNFRNIRALNWGTTSAGTYSLISGDGSGVYKQANIENVDADGNSNGRTIISALGLPNNPSRVSFRNLREVNTTTPGRPVALTTASATPSLAIGCSFTLTNAAPQNVTGFTQLEHGETYMIRFLDANSTLVDGANLQLKGGVNYNPPSGAYIMLHCPDGTKLYEVGRSED